MKRNFSLPLIKKEKKLTVLILWTVKHRVVLKPVYEIPENDVRKREDTDLGFAGDVPSGI